MRDFVCHPKPDINILVGRNNSGKSALLHALDRALGRGPQYFDAEDFFLAGPNVDLAALPRIRIDIEIRPTPEVDFSPAFTGEFVDDIDFDINGGAFLTLRTEAAFDPGEGRARVEYFSVKADGTVRPMPARRRFVLRSYIPFYLADAFRDVLRELRERRGFWGRLIDSIVLDPATVNGIQGNIQTINAAILGNTPRLAEIRDRFREVGHVITMMAPPDDVVLNPLSIEASEILRSLDVSLWTSDAPRGFSLARHGEGTRSVAYLAVFRTFVELLAREENDNTEAQPILGIEEPEVHLHPHARRAIARLLTGLPHQAFISSHSTAIARQAQVDRVMLLRRLGPGCASAQLPAEDPAFPGQPYFEPRQLAVLQRLLRAGGAEAFFASAVILFEGESEARVLSVFAQALGVDLNREAISLVSVDGKAFGPMIRMLHGAAFGIPWVAIADGDNVRQFARQLAGLAIVNQAAIVAAEAAGRIREDVLLPHDWFTHADGWDLERTLISGGAVGEYEAAIATHVGATSLADFVAARPPLAGAALEERVYEFMKAERWGQKYKPLVAGIVADAMTVGGTDPGRIPAIFTEVVTRAHEYARGMRVKR